MHIFYFKNKYYFRALLSILTLIWEFSPYFLLINFFYNHLNNKQLKTQTSQKNNLVKLVHLDNHKLIDYILPIIIFVLFTTLSIIFFKIYGDQAIWSSMKEAGGNAFHFCEHNNMGSGLVQTANTWSNLGFLFVGLFLLFMGIKDARFKNDENRANLLLKYPMFSIIMGISILYLFIGSFFYHASVTFFFQKIDQTGMYAILLSFMGYNIFRIWPLMNTRKRGEVSSHKLILFIFIAINVLFFTYLWKIDVNILFTSLAFSFIAFTIVYNRKNPTVKLSKKLLHFSLVIYLLSMSFWILDRKAVLCDPTSIFQGHALWHILNAVVLLLIYMHYRAENNLLVENV